MGEHDDGDEHGPKPSGREAPVGRTSGGAAAPVIAVRMEPLLAWVALRVAKFPREHKFTVGDRLVETCLDITCALVDASYTRDKHAALAAASRALVRARVVMRMARAVHCVSEAQHLHFAQDRPLGLRRWVRHVAHDPAGARAQGGPGRGVALAEPTRD